MNRDYRKALIALAFSLVGCASSSGDGSDETSGAATATGPQCSSSDLLAVALDAQQGDNPIQGMSLTIRGDKEAAGKVVTTGEDGSFYYPSPACSDVATVTAHIDDTTTATMAGVTLNRHLGFKEPSLREVTYYRLLKEASGDWHFEVSSHGYLPNPVAAAN